MKKLGGLESLAFAAPQVQLKIKTMGLSEVRL